MEFGNKNNYCLYGSISDFMLNMNYVWQKPTQYYKIITLQLKKNFFLRYEYFRKGWSIFYDSTFIISSYHKYRHKNNSGDFPGSPVVKTLPSKADDLGSIPGQEATISHALRPKTPKT